MAVDPAPIPNPAELASTRQRMERLAWLLDGAIPIPGTSFRFGLDSIIGLVPVAGDVLGLLLGTVIVYEAIRVGAPNAVVGRMIGNSAADALLGMVPVVGDVMDFAFKSNQRNAKLLMAHLDAVEGRSPPSKRASRWLALAAIATVALAIAGLGALAWHLL
jgi:hypothetical protein